MGGVDWERAAMLQDFTYPWQGDVPSPMKFQALWDDNKFYFKFTVACKDPVTSRLTDHKLEVVNSDRVEIFFRENDKMSPYFCLEMDSAGRVLDYQAWYYRKFDYAWEWPGAGLLQVKSGRFENGYSVEGSMTLESLRSMNLLQHQKLQAGLYRGECSKPSSGNMQFSWISWIKPGSPKPDFHIPSSFGEIVLA